MCMSKKKTIFSLLSLFLSPITLIGDCSVSLFTVSVTNTPYWLPFRLFFHDYGHQYTLLATATVSFFMITVTNTPYWLPFRLFFHGFGHQYTLLATTLSLFSRFRSPIHLIGYHPVSFFTVSVTNTPYWLPPRLFFHVCGRQFTLLATAPSLPSRLRSLITFINLFTTVSLFKLRFRSSRGLPH
jgi:hypothetical protein